MELAEIYSRAADYIEANGWCQYKLKDEEGKVCLIGSLLAVDPSDASCIRTLRALKQTLSGGYQDSMANWNDTPGRTEEEVIAFLREQAIKAGLTVPATHIIEIPEPEPLEMPVTTPEAEPVEEPDLVPA
jgi:hypothetical protein